jgi:hypothetical protein
VGDRGAEQCEHAIAGEVLDRAAERLDGVDHPPDRAAEDLSGVLGIEPLREPGRAHDVGEQCRDDLALLAHLPPTARFCSSVPGEARAVRWPPGLPGRYRRYKTWRTERSER